MSKVGATVLTARERRTLYGMCRFPNLNDRELGQKLGIGTSTVTAIRRRLCEKGLVRKLLVPSPQDIGMEILYVGYGRFSRPFGQARRGALQKISSRIPGAFIFADGGDAGFFMGVARNYTETKSAIDGFSHRIHEHDIATSPWHYVIFPLQVSKVLNFFDTSIVAGALLGIAGNDAQPAPPLSLEESEVHTLSPKARSTLRELCASPDKPDLWIARKLGLSRQAVSRIRKRCEDTGVLRHVAMPRMAIIGCQLFAFSHVAFNPRCRMADRRDGIALMQNKSPHFFAITGSLECVMLHAFRDYSEYGRVRDMLTDFYRSHDFLQGEPQTLLFHADRLEYPRDFDFTELLAE